MKQITIEIINVGQAKHVPVPGKAGYYTIEVAYKDNGKVGGRKFVSFKEPQVFEALKELQTGDTVQIAMEKEAGTDGREYWVWKEVTKVESSSEQASSPAPQAAQATPIATPTSTGTKAGGKVLGSNYETPEERARKQVFIVRQSSVDQARQYLNTLIGENNATLEDILEVATKIEEHIFNGYEKIYEEGGIQKESRQKASSKATDVVAESKSGPNQAGQVLNKPRRGRPPKAQSLPPTAAGDDPTEDIPF